MNERKNFWMIRYVRDGYSLVGVAGFRGMVFCPDADSVCTNDGMDMARMRRRTGNLYRAIQMHNKSIHT